MILRSISNSTEPTEYKSVWESDHGGYLVNTLSQGFRNAIGYVPFDRLDYVEPGEVVGFSS